MKIIVVLLIIDWLIYRQTVKSKESFCLLVSFQEEEEKWKTVTLKKVLPYVIAICKKEASRLSNKRVDVLVHKFRGTL